MRDWLGLAFVFCLLGSVTLLARADDLEQIGANDYRISDTDEGVPFGLGGRGDLAFNPQLQEFLAVWSGLDSSVGAAEIHGQRLDADGNLVGATSFRISLLSQGNPAFEAFSPAVAYNPARQEYLVVWYGKDFFLPGQGNEIYGQRLAANGSSIGSNFRISETGDGSPSFNAFEPAVVYNSNDQEFLVVWHADDGGDGMVDDEFEIFGQLLNAVGGEIGGDFRISTMGGSGVETSDASDPDVAFDPVTGWYLVAWAGAPGDGAFAVGEFEIFGQLLDSAGQEIGVDDFLISDLGGFGDGEFDAGFPEVALHETAREWWVVWAGDDNVGGLIDGEFEIFGQRLTMAGAEVGDNDFRVSTQGGTGNLQFSAFVPTITYDAYSEGMLVVWGGTSPMSGQEIYAQSLSADASLNGRSKRISDMGPEFDPSYSADFPSAAGGGADGQLLVLWNGRDDENGQPASAREIFAQRLAYPLFCDGFESGDFDAWSAVMP